MTATATTGENYVKGEFKPLEAGEYLIRMNRVTEKKSKSGNTMLKVGFQVIKKVGDEENTSKSKNRLIFENFLIDHPKPKVNEITRDRLDKFLKAVGVEGGLTSIGEDYSKLDNYTELPFIGVVGIKEGDNGYPDSNTIKAFKRR